MSDSAVADDTKSMWALHEQDFFRDTDIDKLPFCSLLCSILATCGRMKKRSKKSSSRCAREQPKLAVC